MPELKTILAINGSTRQNSSNHQLINAIRNLYSDQLNLILLDGLTELPHFNPDLDNESPPSQVLAFREQLRAADGILICTPEYAMGVPGTLKNAIDWTVSSMEFSHKPLALITASSVGEKGHASLLETLKIIEAAMTEATQFLIPFVKTKIKDEKITDAATLEAVHKLMDSLLQLIRNKTK